MRCHTIQKKLPWLALMAGLAALGLRTGLYALAVDSRGLLRSGHPLEIALYCLTALTLGFLSWSSWKLEGELCFPPSFSGAAGQVLAGAGILLTVLLNRPQTGNLAAVWRLLGYLSFPCLLAAAFCRVRGRTPFFLLHLVPCLFLVIHIIDHYQTWSSDPQLQDYVFSLFSALAMMLFAFYDTAFDTGLSHPRLHTAVGLGTVYLSLAGIASSPFLSLGAIAWAMTGLGTLRKEHVR